MRYTDVDRLLLERWTEVVALRSAFDGLLDRMRETIEGGGMKANRWVEERGWKMDFGAKDPYIDFYRPEWERRGEAALYFRIGDFAPTEYGAVDNDHPYTWLLTGDLGRLKLSEAERGAFGRELRKALGAEASKWDHRDCNDAAEPIGRFHEQISDLDRVRWMSHPDELTQFLTSSMEEAMALAPTIDTVLGPFRKV